MWRVHMSYLVCCTLLSGVWCYRRCKVCCKWNAMPGNKLISPFKKRNSKFHIVLVSPIAHSLAGQQLLYKVKHVFFFFVFFLPAIQLHLIRASLSASDWKLFFINGFRCLASLKDSGPHGNWVSSGSRSIKIFPDNVGWEGRRNRKKKEGRGQWSNLGVSHAYLHFYLESWMSSLHLSIHPSISLGLTNIINHAGVYPARENTFGQPSCHNC